ncbi:hypothetical protein Sjap_019877 [Stephania japonica]|uniref:Uncharacterized protein n=1 Tax=Stephania japonica TaxID=461633 RepID=A0AAP0F701_9MAGN
MFDEMLHLDVRSWTAMNFAYLIVEETEELAAWSAIIVYCFDLGTQTLVFLLYVQLEGKQYSIWFYCIGVVGGSFATSMTKISAYNLYSVKYGVADEGLLDSEGYVDNNEISLRIVNTRLKQVN